MNSFEKLQAEIDNGYLKMNALGRPATHLPWSDLAGQVANRDAKLAWDAANPALASQHGYWRERIDALMREQDELADQQAYASTRVQRLKRVGCGVRAIMASAEPQATQALNNVAEWFQSGKCWLVLTGSRGVGKTVAATWAIETALERRQSALARSAAEVAALGYQQPQEFARLKRVEFLVVEELGADHANDFAKSRLFELLDARHEAKAQTILVSNLSLGDLAKRLGDRLADRIRSDGMAFEIKAASLRNSGATP